VLEARPPVLSFVFGIPSREILRALRQRAIRTIGAATTVDEARALEEAGVDLIVASGSDAGGHRPSFLGSAEKSLTGTFALIPQVVDAVDTPIVAAGGIGDGRGIVAALVLGAEGAQLGTVFLATDESGASEAHKAELVSESARFTALTRVFSGRLARGIRNRFIEEMSSHETELPPYPIQNWFTRSIRGAADRAGRAEYLPLWAGQSAALGQRRPAAVTFAALVEGTEQLLLSPISPLAKEDS
jgi:nitronate monooxygenase